MLSDGVLSAGGSRRGGLRIVSGGPSAAGRHQKGEGTLPLLRGHPAEQVLPNIAQRLG